MFGINIGITSSSKLFPEIQPVREVIDVEDQAPINAVYNTSFNSLPLPTTVKVTFDDASFEYLGVVWTPGIYNRTAPDDYTIVGQLQLIPDTANTLGVIATIVVNVLPEVHDVVSVESQADVTVTEGTDFGDLVLPSTVDVTLDDASVVAMAVTWAQGTYDPNVEDTYTLEGTLTLSENTANPDIIKASIDVIVIDGPADDRNITAVAAQTAKTVAYNTAFGSLGLPTTVNVTLEDNSVISVSVTWLQGSYNATSPNTYALNGNLTLPQDITNDSNLQAHINVTVQPNGATQDGVHVKKPKGTTGALVGFWQFLPDDYSQTVDTYPCIIFAHGAGERGLGTSTDLDKVPANGPPKHIKNGWNAQVSGEKYIVFSPQTINWTWTTDLWPFVKWLKESSGYRIDPNRIYLTGLSMGGHGSWITSFNAENHPNIFAAIAPICASGGPSGSWGTNAAAEDIKVWAFHGDADTDAPLAGGRRPIDAMIAAGAVVAIDNSMGAGNNPESIFTIYPGVGHSGAWDRAYRINNVYHNPNLYEWFLTKSL